MNRYYRKYITIHYDGVHNKLFDQNNMTSKPIILFGSKQCLKDYLR